jgi:CheY-like chemotaxis protein
MAAPFRLGKILIVDDRAEFRKLAAEILTPYCGAIFECDDGSEVISIYAHELPDWVVMDLQMRFMDGLTATRQLLGQFPGVRVVIVTGNAGPGMEEAAQKAGATAFLSKEDLSLLPALLLSKNQPS